MNELPNPRQTRTQSVVSRLIEATKVEPARAVADEIFAEKDAALKMSLLSMAATINPFAVPHLPSSVQASSIFTVDAWGKSLAMARMVAANTVSKRILVASAPKTGSTFIAGSLERTYSLARVSLTLLSARSYGHYQFGGGLRDHDVDELALITTAYAQNGYVAHHHMIGSPYLGKQCQLYGITPVVTKRNLFDTFVSFDDHIMKLRGTGVDIPYLHFGFPDAWYDMEFEDRLDYLLDYQLPWYSRYYASWRLTQQEGYIDPLWIDYETDILGPKQALAEKLVARLKADEASIPALTAELGKSGVGDDKFNKGIAGRGAKITGRNRQKIEDFVHRFRISCDLTDLLDG
ncbi:MAG: hypothetical protein KL863_21945 [Rhizobium sp.]|nr:hypothetical protein [Rhizobium sp.]